jgi:hypothetical protein
MIAYCTWLQVGDKIVIVIFKKIGGYWLQFNYKGVILDSNLPN